MIKSMRAITFIILIFTLISCQKSNKQTIDIICTKSFLYKNGSVNNYYFVLDVYNRTNNDIKLETNKIKYITDDNKELYFEFGGNVLTNPNIDFNDEREIWKVKPKENLKLMYYIESNENINHDYIYLIVNNRKNDSIKVSKYVELKKPMSFERSVYEVDGTINGEKPQINW